VGNLVLMCKPDHREVHHGDWVVQIVDGVVVVTRPGWAEPGHPDPGHPDPGHPDPWGGGAARPDDPPSEARPDDPLWESGGPGDPAQGESPSGGSPAGGWRQGGRGSGAGERAWPWSGDPPPLLSKEAADRLNPWGDYQPSATPSGSEQATATTEASPWSDSEDASPWGDSEVASPGP
jgi:hypothetical protein